MLKKRLDLFLVEKGLVATRERAQALILAGQVLVDDVPHTKPGHSVSNAALIRIRGVDHPYVSRGGVKLEAAISTFKIETKGRIALDVGVSTGGFSHVLLLRDVLRVHGIDVGRNQLDWQIRNDPRMFLKEQTNARYLKFEQIGEKVDLIVIDVSFISLEKVLPALIQFAHADTDWVVLIKPQFEVGREKVGKKGVVTSEADRQGVVERIIHFGRTLGLARQGLMDSPITGAEGNKEFLVHWKLV